MGANIFAYIVHRDGKLDDSALELITAAKKIDADADVTAVVLGSSVDAAADEAAKTYKAVWKVSDAALDYPNAELIRPLLLKVLPENAIVLVPFDSFGLDLAPGLSVKMGAAYSADVIDFEGVADNNLTAHRQEYSGQVYAKMEMDISSGAVIAVRPGAFTADESGAAGGAVEDKTAAALEGGLPEIKRKYIEVLEAEVGDVDITKSEILVSVGRGIESDDNLELAFELAKAMGADVSCSRPIVDSKWLEKSRQVGTSGQTVKPKVYMALGISGAFQHLGGLKGNPYVVAVNKNAKAPIFQVADVGIVGDVLEVMPELAEKIEEMKG